MPSRRWVNYVSGDFLDHEQTPLSDSQVRVLLVLEDHAREKIACWTGNERLAKRTGKQEKTIRDILKSLEDLDWIKRIYDSDLPGRFGILLLKRINPMLPKASPE